MRCSGCSRSQSLVSYTGSPGSKALLKQTACLAWAQVIDWPGCLDAQPADREQPPLMLPALDRTTGSCMEDQVASPSSFAGMAHLLLRSIKDVSSAKSMSNAPCHPSHNTIFEAVSDPCSAVTAVQSLELPDLPSDAQGILHDVASLPPVCIDLSLFSEKSMTGALCMLCRKPCRSRMVGSKGKDCPRHPSRC